MYYNTIMNDIITVEKEECFIDSDSLADLSKIEGRAINQLIKNRASDLERFGSLSFRMIYHGESGGRPKKLYFLNEQQATLLSTFMKNSETIREFKYNLVKAFFEMRTFIESQRVTRTIGKEVRKSLTDAVKDSGEVERMHGHAYSTYTRLAYSLIGIYPAYQEFKKTAGKDATAKFRDTLDGTVLERLKTAESMIKSLLSLDKEYSEIKESLKPFFEVKERHKSYLKKVPNGIDTNDKR